MGAQLQVHQCRIANGEIAYAMASGISANEINTTRNLRIDQTAVGLAPSGRSAR
jgi:hypothetical protein